MISDADLAHWQALAEKATRGPWHFCDDEDGLAQVAQGVSCKEGLTFIATTVVTHDDAAFIAVAREAVPALLAEVRRLRGVRITEPQVRRLSAIASGMKWTDDQVQPPWRDASVTPTRTLPLLTGEEEENT